MLDPRQLIEARHPDYRKYEPLWRYYSDHAEGGPDYALKPNPIYTAVPTASLTQVGTGTYLMRHSLETSTDFLTRANRAPFVDLCSPAVDLLTGTVGGPEHVVADIPPDFEDIWANADLAGNSFLSFMAAVRRHAAIFGHSFVLVDSVKAAGELRTQADVLAQRIRPFLREVTPLDLLNWRLDPSGQPLEILFRIARDVPGSMLDCNGETAWEYRYWSASEWRVYSQVGDKIELIDSGANSINAVPIVPVYHRMVAAFRGDSLLKQSARYTQLLTGWLSDLDRTLEMQSFSQACLRSADEPSKVGVGASQVLHLHPEQKSSDEITGAEDYFFRSPDSAPIATFLDAFFRVIDLANESMSFSPEATTDKSHPESGVSRAWRWHAAEKRLVQMATNEQSAARAIFGLAANWKGQQEFSGNITYSTSFDLSAVEDDITNMITLQAAGLPPTARTELMRAALRKALPNTRSDVQKQIDAELEHMATMPVIQPPPQPEA